MSVYLTKEQRTRIKRALKVIQDRERSLAAERDKIQTAINNLESLQDISEEALEHLCRARESLSELV